MASKSAQQLLRSTLFVPASNVRAIEKSLTLDADSIIYDLEDSVASDAKNSARQNLLNVFSGEKINHRSTVIRTNNIGSSDYLNDLDIIARCCPTAVLLPKVSVKSEVESFAQDANTHGLSGEIKSWFMIETAAGIGNLAELISTAQRSRFELQCLVIGHNDLAKETGVSLAHNRRYLVPWLMNIVLQAKHNDLDILDSVWNNFKDTDGFNAECTQAKQMGFSGKTLIHPAQISIANLAFSPNEDEIRQAKEIVMAYRLPENSNAGVINLGGKMVERLHLQQAQQLLEKHGIVT